MGIGGDQFDPRKAAGGQRPQEGQPAGPVLGGGDVNPEDLAVALGVDPDRDQRVHVDHTPLFTDFEDQSVGGHEGVRAGVEGPGAERFDRGVELFGHHADLSLRQAGDAEGCDEFVHPPGGDPEQIAGGHHGGQRPLGAFATLQ